jgi:hydroxymethylpyrimidine/phosphomethylpyrimidine kinase
MTPTTPRTPPYALTIASSDASGGAGIQADLKAMSAFGVYGGSVIVGVTAQNTQGVTATEVLPLSIIDEQYSAVIEDLPVAAIKLGMLATQPVVAWATDVVGTADCPVVVDPVMVATSGDQLLEDAAVTAYRGLIGQATLITPNADETRALTGIDPTGPDARARAAAQYLEWGTEAVLFKGGHVDRTGETVVDVLVTADAEHRFTHPRIGGAMTHGSGCTLASAITAGLARGDELVDAVAAATDYVHRAVAHPAAIGANGSVNHLVTPPSE